MFLQVDHVTGRLKHNNVTGRHLRLKQFIVLANQFDSQKNQVAFLPSNPRMEGSKYPTLHTLLRSKQPTCLVVSNIFKPSKQRIPKRNPVFGRFNSKSLCHAVGICGCEKSELWTPNRSWKVEGLKDSHVLTSSVSCMT